MNLPSLTVNEKEIEEKLEEYKNADPAVLTKKDELITEAYQALMDGQQVIDIVAAVRKGGYSIIESEPDFDFFSSRTTKSKFTVPNLGLANATWKEVQVDVDEDGSITYRKRSDWSGSINLPDGTLQPKDKRTQIKEHSNRVSSVVPVIPPALRPEKAELRKHHILFEAEWKATMPADPALLKHIGGDLYIVKSTWDLTEVELKVLS